MTQSGVLIHAHSDGVGRMGRFEASEIVRRGSVNVHT